MPLTVINDIHAGVIRTAGTTPTSAVALKKQVLADLGALLPESGDLMILGDLFDTHNVPYDDVLKVYFLLSGWLTSHRATLYLVAGNHDLSKSSHVMSSFDFLCALLMKLHRAQVVVIKDRGVQIPWGYVIPHVPNQDLFNLELSKVPECENLFLHVNYDNNFAAQSDQSLNISREQVAACKASSIILGHEHHYRVDHKVLIPGSQTATSIADWLAPSDRYMLVIHDDRIKSIVRVKKREDWYIDLDWQHANESDKPFIRISGKATPADSTRVLNTIANVRAKSQAFCVGNSVQIVDSSGIVRQAAVTLETLQGFNVKQALYKRLTPAQIEKLESLK